MSPLAVTVAVLGEFAAIADYEKGAISRETECAEAK